VARLQVRLLGGFEARWDGGPELVLKGRKAQALLATLALTPGVARSRDNLIGLLWSDRGEDQARGSLRQALTELRKAFADLDPPPLIADRETVRIDPDAVEVDAATFERLIDEGTVEALTRAAELYRGDLLEGFDARDAAFDEWLSTERTRLREHACEALYRLLDYQSGEAATGTARRLLELDPLNEASHRALMRLYAETGNRGMAIKQYEACREMLRAELGLQPDADTESLLEEIRASATNRAVRGRAGGPSTDRPHPLSEIYGDKKVPVIGGCLCGEIRYEISEPAMDTAYCHCRMCRKFSGAPIAASSTYPAEALHFTRGEPKYYKSSPFSERGFCANCGSSLTYRPINPPVTPDWAGWISVDIGSLDNPEPNLPTWHLGIESKLSWLDIHDRKVRIRCQDAPDLVEAWAAFNLPVP
jgi:DNA-binding SARP family transcriptional activator